MLLAKDARDGLAHEVQVAVALLLTVQVLELLKRLENLKELIIAGNRSSEGGSLEIAILVLRREAFSERVMAVIARSMNEL